MSAPIGKKCDDDDVIEKITTSVIQLGAGHRIVFLPQHTPSHCILDFHGPNGENIPMNWEAFYRFQKVWNRILQMVRLWSPFDFTVNLYTDFDADTLIEETINVLVRNQTMHLTHHIKDSLGKVCHINEELEIPREPCLLELEKIMPRLGKEFWYKYQLQLPTDSISSDSDELDAVTTTLQRNRITLRNRRRAIRRYLLREQEIKLFGINRQ